MKKTMMFLASLLLALPAQLLAQENDNLWLNPGFEELNEQQNPMHWRIPDDAKPLSLPFIVRENPHTGTNCIELSPSGRDQYIFLEDTNRVVEGLKQIYLHTAADGDVFTFSYWHRGDLKKPNLMLELEYYNAERQKIGDKVIIGSDVKPEASWQQKVVSLPVKASDLKGNNSGKTIAFIAIRIRMASFSGFGSPGRLFVDDFSLTRQAATPPIQKPEGLRVGEFERELELSWAESGDSEVTWEVQLGDNGTKHETSVPHFIVTGLEPNTSYTVKVFAKKGDTRTEATEWQGKTSSSFREKDQEDRIPHLRTFSRGQGQIKGRVLHLFYKDLYNANAKFIYWLNGTEVQPKEGYKLEFPSTGKHTLRIRIEESDTEVWVLNYNVQVND